MGDRDKPINSGDLMYAATWAGKVWAHVTPREVSRSPAAFEGGLRKSVNTDTVKTPRRCTRYKRYERILICAQSFNWMSKKKYLEKLCVRHVVESNQPEC